MREIKFRIWSTSNKIMYDDIGVWRFVDYENTPLGNYEIMQFTGLKDKNGKEIYEGDILTCDHYKVEKYDVVEFKNGIFYIDKMIPTNYRAYHVPEVIGNIYENPDLLDVKE